MKKFGLLGIIALAAVFMFVSCGGGDEGVRLPALPGDVSMGTNGLSFYPAANGDTLTANYDGDIEDDDLIYQWSRGGEAIPGANNKTYTIQWGNYDTYTVAVRAPGYRSITATQEAYYPNPNNYTNRFNITNIPQAYQDHVNQDDGFIAFFLFPMSVFDFEPNTPIQDNIELWVEDYLEEGNVWFLGHTDYADMAAYHAFTSVGGGINTSLIGSNDFIVGHDDFGSTGWFNLYILLSDGGGVDDQGDDIDPEYQLYRTVGAFSITIGGTTTLNASQEGLFIPVEVDDWFED